MEEDLFFDEIEKIASIVKALIKEKHVKVVSHHDADGLCSASILVRALTRAGASFEFRIVKQLTDYEIGNLDVSESELLVLSDLGSGQINELKHILEKTQVLILDHHDPVRHENMNLFHINPLVLGEEEISASMVCYLFAKALDPRNNDLIDLAVVGSIGDLMDEKWELKGLGRKVLEEAETLGKVSIAKGLRLYGRNSRPIFRSLQYSSETVIPGVTGSESNSVQFLSELGIDIKDGERWRKLKDLTEDENRKLATAIIMERLKNGQSDAEDVFGEIYTLVGRPKELQDVREFATLLNACGRTGNYGTAIKLCLNDLTAIQESWDIMKNYKLMISKGLNWIRDGNFTDNGKVALIEGGKRIPDTVIGTVSSIALSSGMVNPGRVVVGLSEDGQGNYKVSARISRDLDINLRDIVVDAARAVGGEAGGHRFAAGALIECDKKAEFIKALEDSFGEAISKG